MVQAAGIAARPCGRAGKTGSNYERAGRTDLRRAMSVCMYDLSVGNPVGPQAAPKRRDSQGNIEQEKGRGTKKKEVEG